MSDSYTAWCEEQEERYRKYSAEQYSKTELTKKFRRLFEKALEEFKTAEVSQCKRCGNCKFRVFATYPTGEDYVDTCSKLGLKDISENWVCEKWKPQYGHSGGKISGLKVNPHSIAFGILKNE